jgi:hypothetical protein
MLPTQTMEKWRSLVKTVTDLWVLEYAENLSTNY